MYYLLNDNRRLVKFLNDNSITPNGYVKDTLVGNRYIIIDCAAAMAIKLIQPDNVYISAYGPFQQMNIEAIKEYLEVDFDMPLNKWHDVDRKNALNFLLSRSTDIV